MFSPLVAVVGWDIMVVVMAVLVGERRVGSGTPLFDGAGVLSRDGESPLLLLLMLLLLLPLRDIFGDGGSPFMKSSSNPGLVSMGRRWCPLSLLQLLLLVLLSAASPFRIMSSKLGRVPFRICTSSYGHCAVLGGPHG